MQLEERAAVPHLYLLSSLSRRIDRLPGLRDRLWRLEGDTLARIWRSLGAGDLDAASDRGERLGRLIGPRLRKQQHVLFNLATAFPHWSRLQVEAMAPRVWGTLGRVLVEYACLDRICDPAEGRVRVVDLGGVRACPAQRPARHLRGPAPRQLEPAAGRGGAGRASRSPWSTAGSAIPRSSG